MNAPHPLSDIAQQYNDVSTHKQKLSDAVAQDKAGRGLAGKIYDFIADTSSEEALAEYDKTFGRVHKEAEYRVDRWVDNNVMHQIKANPEEFRDWKEQGEKLRELDGYTDGFGQLIKRGERVHELLLSASSACNRAIAGEVVDAFSRSRAVAAVSGAITSSAQRSVHSALYHLNNFNNELGNGSPELKSYLSGMGIDTFVDMIYAPGSDVFSALNAGSLYLAGKECKQHAVKVQESLAPLYQIMEKLTAESQVFQDALGRIEEKYRVPLQQSVPQPLQAIVNPNDKVDYRTFVDTEHKLTTNMTGANELLKGITADRDKKNVADKKQDLQSPAYG